MTTKTSKSLRGKFVRILLLVTTLMGFATSFIVVLMSVQASSEYFHSVQKHIQDGIISKGKVLTEQHALALRGLIVDNAFLDIQRLVERAVHDDEDLVYGLFVNSERVTLAKARRGDRVDAAELPDGKAWSTLGLKEGELLVTATKTTRSPRLGQDLLEVAVPVISEEGEALGTIRYGLSTRRMHEALQRAKADSDSRLAYSIVLLIGLVGTVMIVGLLLSRAQAVRITKPVDDLTRAAEALATGDRSVRVDIRSQDELSVLGTSFNRMVDELDGSYRQLEQMNRTLENKVEARTAELALKNRDMRLVLDNVDQGFISLSLKGQMAGEHSAIVGEWFGESREQQSFWEYIGQTSRSFALTFQLAWAQIEEGFMPLEVCLDQLPQQLHGGDRTWSFRYLPFYRSGALDGVLLVVADITDRLAREREEAEHGELMQGFKKLMLDRSGFSSFLREATGMVERISAPDALADSVALKHVLHTLKGNAGVMGLTVVAQLCHRLETELAEESSMNERTLEQLCSRWTAIREHVATFIGNSGQRVIEIPEMEFTALIGRLSRGGEGGQAEVLHQLLSWQLDPAERALSRIAEQAKSLARRLGRGDIDVEVDAKGVRLDPHVWTPFFSEMVHVIRNAIDHGLELPNEREAQGKPPHGTLVLRAHIEGSMLTFEVSDDGRGISWAKIAESAKRRGLPHSSHAELIEALCTDGVSTRSEVTQTSGRGVGMTTFRNQVRALNGQLEVRSAIGVGTTWVARFRWPSSTHSTPSARPSGLRTSDPAPQQNQENIRSA